MKVAYEYPEVNRLKFDGKKTVLKGKCHVCINRYKTNAKHEYKMTGFDINQANGICSPPMQTFRRRYLWVSDLLSQSWCEQQMVYNFTVPVEVVEKPEITAGSELHLARGKIFCML